MEVATSHTHQLLHNSQKTQAVLEAAFDVVLASKVHAIW